tara:strand:- start:20 stop:328 length:309 start_codon:yes stop_codon:yes gene_type:complete
MNNEIYSIVLERLLEEAELNEFSTMAGGAVVGVAPPLGAGPSGSVEYKSPDATDKPERSKSKSKKTKKSKNKKSSSPKNYLMKSPQYYLKHGGEKTRKRSFK